jgi:phage baseplate assembly protein W
MAQFIGISFPFRKGPEGLPQGAVDDELIRDSIIQVILTGRGERVMRPTVGSAVYRFVFENNDLFLGDLIATEVRAVLARSEPRIIVETVETRIEDTSTYVDVLYIVRATGERQELSVQVPIT